jgi:hypothetical protein
MGISRLNWGELNEARPPWSPTAGHLYAIWPSPVDHDVCFEAAGFTEFGDSDDAWHRDFADLVARALNSLAHLGDPVLREGHTVDREGRRVSFRDALIVAATDDNFPPCVVGFGDPPKASVRTSDGHAILWTWVSENVELDAFLDRLAEGREVVNRTMKWEKLA